MPVNSSNSTSWKRLHEPYVNSSFPDIPDQIKWEIMNMWIEAIKSFNEKAIRAIDAQLNFLPGAVKIIATC